MNSTQSRALETLVYEVVSLAISFIPVYFTNNKWWLGLMVPLNVILAIMKAQGWAPTTLTTKANL